MKFFRHKASLTVTFPAGEALNQFGARVVEIADLRVQFRVRRHLSKEPNTAEIIVTNLSEQSRADLQGKGIRVVLNAGYEDAESSLFVGDVRDVDSSLDGPDWNTVIQCGDGERGYRFGRTSGSWRAGVRVTDVLRKIAEDMQLDSSTIKGAESLAGRQFVAGYVAHGRSAKELDRILKGYVLEWSIQDGRLQVLSPPATTAESIVELSADTGMIGSPTLSTPEKRGDHPVLRVRSLLQPDIRPGRKISVDSITGIKGTFKVLEVEHSGDTHGGEWFTDIEGRPL